MLCSLRFSSSFMHSQHGMERQHMASRCAGMSYGLRMPPSAGSQGGKPDVSMPRLAARVCAIRARAARSADV